MTARLGIDIALTQLGVSELSGQNDGVPAERYNRGDELPWCAAFCLWCNEHSDEVLIAENNVRFYANRAVQGFEDDMKKRGWWLPVQVTVPKRGDLIFFGDRGASDKSLAGRHMGIIEKVVQSEKFPFFILTTVEGNLGNKVQRVVHDLGNPKTLARITGYSRIPLK